MHHDICLSISHDDILDISSRMSILNFEFPLKIIFLCLGLWFHLLQGFVFHTLHNPLWRNDNMLCWYDWPWWSLNTFLNPTILRFPLDAPSKFTLIYPSYREDHINYLSNGFIFVLYWKDRLDLTSINLGIRFWLWNDFLLWFFFLQIWGNSMSTSPHFEDGNQGKP